MKLVVYLVIFSSVFTLLGQAKDSAVEVQLKPIKRTGFYKIFLPPTITGKTKNNFDDFLLVDDKEKNVPYYLYSEDFKKEKAIFEEFEIKEKTDTSLLLEKKNTSPFKEFVMRVKKRNLTKHFRIQGSDNLKDWKTFKKEFKWNPSESTQKNDTLYIQNDTIGEHVVNIGNNNFKYFRVTYLDSLRNNFDFISLGSNNRSILETSYTEIKAPLFEQHFDKNTEVTTFMISFYQQHFLDRLDFTFTKHNLQAKNNAKLYEVYEENGKQKERLLREFVLNEDEINVLNFKRLSVKKLVLRVEHHEKEPLLLKQINAYELKKYLVTYLYRHKNYTLKFGSETLTKPVYDEASLASFKKQLITSLPEATLRDLKKPVKRWKPIKIEIFEHKAWYWSGIIFFFVLLLLFITHLFIEYHKKLEHDKLTTKNLETKKTEDEKAS